MNRTANTLLIAVLAWAIGSRAGAAEPSPAEFFEKAVRPLLVEKCVTCHGGKKTKAGLALTSRARLLEGGNSGPAVVPGKPDESLLIKVLLHKDPHLPRMPPTGGKLKDEQMAVLARWVQLGVPWPDNAPVRTIPEPGSQFTDEERRFWSFQPVKAVGPPAVKDSAWPQTAVDRFILARLEAEGLKPARRADKRTLIRRATFDLTGLPPTPEEIAAFEADNSADAFAKVVDRLLASPHYGERWGRHWLDVVRYADSSGRVSDFPEIWRYRDWVTAALNRDMPYNKFVALQIAGDLMQPDDPARIDGDALIATGMLAIAQFDPGNVNKKAMNADYVDDQVDVVGRAFLGLTLACARCHDHKFDPISTDDYYALAGIFFNSRAIENLNPDPSRVFAPLLPKPEAVRIEQQKAADKKRLAELQQQVRALPLLGGSLPALVAVPSYGQFLGAAAQFGATGEVKLTGDQIAKLRRELETLKKKPVAQIPRAVVVRDGGHADGDFATFHDGRVYSRGDPDRPGKMVARGFPTILAGDQPVAIAKGSGRLELARWLARPEHPLTARVMVNRVWQHHLGEGIVRTANNFGSRGERPTHPELLDYLADQFVRSGWSLKAMHRLIMLSSAYQQESRAAAASLARDPENRLFSRMNRRRLEAEAVRDSLLFVAGRLDHKIGGPGFRDLAVPRRTHYLMTVRSETNPSGFGPLFDRPDPSLVSERRDVSNVAPQALFLLNDAFVVAQAKALAFRLGKGLQADDSDARIERLYLTTLGRRPTRAEIEIGRELLAPAEKVDPWERYCQLLLCTNEFIYVD